MKLKLNDNVLVISGKYRGKKGKILRVFHKLNKIVVEKINIRTKHVKKHQGAAGQKISFEAPMDPSNVMVICPHCEKTTRVAHLILKTGKKQRVCKKCKQSIDQVVEIKKTKKR